MPNREVTWGEQTWDEMIFGVIRYRNVTEDAQAQPQKGPSQEELFTERQAGAAVSRASLPTDLHRYISRRRRGTRNGSRRAA